MTRVAAALAVLITVLAPALGGSTEPWSQGVILTMFGLGLLITPPRVAPHRFAWPAFIAAVLLAVAAFFPVGSLVGWPAYDRLQEELQIPSGLTLTPQPWLTLEAVMLMVAGIAWWWWIATALPDSARGRANLARWIAAGMMVLAGIALAVREGWFAISFWPGFAPLGSFPNKNQMGNLLGTWAIVATAASVEGFRSRSIAGFGWLAGVGVLLLALMGTQSRGGVLVFVAGILCWGLWEGARRKRYREIGIALGAALCGLAAFFAVGGDAFHKFVRLMMSAGDGAGVPDFRVPIFRDTLRMIGEAPFTGIGLGNFEALFSFYRDASAVPSRALHPESDWLWLVAELGWLALPICGLLLLPAFTRMAQRRDGDAVLRAAAVAGAMFLLQGFLDVAGHRLGSALPGIFLLGISIGPTRSSRGSGVTSSVFRALAIPLMVMGAAWIAGSAGNGFDVPGKHGAARRTQEARMSIAREDFERGELAASAGLQWAPLDWELQFLRGTARVYLGDFDSAQQDFRRARALESTNADIAWREGELWAYFDAARNAEAWTAALQRSGENKAEMFRKMTQASSGLPGMSAILETLAGNDPVLQLRYLETLPSEALEVELPRWLDGMRVTVLPHEEQRHFFQLWRKLPEIALLESWLADHAAFLPAAWRVVAERAARTGNTRRAVELALEHLPSPPLPQFDPQPLGDARREFYGDPSNIAAGYRTFQAQRKAGMSGDALTTLQKLGELAAAPGYLPYLRAMTLAELRAWDEAWREIERYHP